MERVQSWRVRVRAGLAISCASRAVLTLGAKRVPMPFSGRMSSKRQLCEGGREAPFQTFFRVAAIFPLPDTRARQKT